MPYIKTNERLSVDAELQIPATTGQLNYQLTRCIVAYLDQSGLNYTAINNVIGALEACKLEFYRRVVVPYEDKKILENGDVY